MSRVPCFWLEPTGQVRLYLRRFAWSEPGTEHYHSASIFLADEPTRWVTDDGEPWVGIGPRHVANYDEPERRPAPTDPRWPSECHCGYQFRLDDEWQVQVRHLYRRTDTDALWTTEEAPAGALWDAWWLPDAYRGPDGIALLCKTPGGDWTVDGPARPGPGRWTRTGNPREPATLHVTPSIMIGGYHGFLRAGGLDDA